MTTPALELRDVRKDFGGTEIIRGAHLQVRRGERLALIGPNGAGKSTLFNLMSGYLAPSSGDILLDGQSIVGRPPEAVNRRGLARSFQISSFFPRLSVFENLRCAVLWSKGLGYSFWHRLSALRAVNERAEEVMEVIGLGARRDTEAGLLAYADLRALEVGLTVAGGAQTILLDEPTAGMSRAESDAAVELIRKVTQGRTLVMVEHDMGVVFGLADRIAVLVYGVVVVCGTPAEIQANEEVREAYLGSHAARESHA